MDWSEIPELCLPTSYFQVLDSYRYWLALPCFPKKDEMRPLGDLEIIETLESGSIPWAPAPFIKSGYEISIPFLEVWKKPEEFRRVLDKISDKEYGQCGLVFFREDAMMSALVPLRYLRDNDKILQKASWFSPQYPVALKERKADGFLWSYSLDCFEEVHYLYHLGFFDDSNPQTIENIKRYIIGFIDNDRVSNAIHGRHVKILY